MKTYTRQLISLLREDEKFRFTTMIPTTRKRVGDEEVFSYVKNENDQREKLNCSVYEKKSKAGNKRKSRKG